jgi:hypothetical protein
VGEPLPRYIQSIRDAALVFQINDTESQVVARIVEGLTPSQRARFVFQASPNNFQDFEQLVVLDRNITYAEKTRKIPAATVRVNAVETHATTSTTRQFQSSSGRNSVTSNSVVCYYCGIPGNIQRNCRARSYGMRNQARCSSSRT